MSSLSVLYPGEAAGTRLRHSAVELRAGAGPSLEMTWERWDSPALTSMRSSLDSESPEMGSRPFSSDGDKQGRERG